MKAILLFCSILLASTALMAQDQANRPTVIGGSVSYQSSSAGENRPKNTDFSLSPYLARSMGNHWLLGIQLTTINQKNYLPQIDQSYERSSFGAGVFARYTFNPLQTIQLYLEPGIGFGSGSEGLVGADSGLDNQTFNLGVQPGLAYSPSSHWRFLLRLGGIQHQATKLKASNGEVLQTEKIFSLNMGLTNLQLGAEYCF